MARGRMISRTLGTSSKKFAQLRANHPAIGLFAQALYPLLVACSDDFGRLDGDAFAVKHAVWPTAPESETDFDAALTALHAEALVVRYRVDDVTCLQIVDFERHQSGLHKRTASHFPDFPGTSRPREEKRREEKGTNNPPTPLAGGRATRADRKQAKELRDKSYGRCPHEPRCARYADCIESLAIELAARRQDAQVST